MASVLLHSLTFYAELIEALAAVPPCPDVIEIGSETGEMSVVLAGVAAARGGTLYVVEPFPSARLRALADEMTNVKVIDDFSPAAFSHLPRAGLYVVDGDHNYVTVRAEVEAIFGDAASRDAMAVMHDIGWPSGRRDQYYAPDRLPADAVWPHSFSRGAVLDQADLAGAQNGFRGNGSFAFALHEGGPQNGVRTAIEDVLSEREDLGFLTTPLVFGLGVIGHRESTTWPQVQRLMAPYVDNPTLAAMERNRLALLLRVIELQDSSLRARLGRAKDRLQPWRRGKEHS